MITKFQGETIKKEVEILNADKTPADLTGCTATAGIKQGTTTTRLTPLISVNIVSIRIDDTSDMIGIYELEIKLKDTTLDIDVIARDTIVIQTSVIPDFTEVP